jgi:hypothetical protein
VIIPNRCKSTKWAIKDAKADHRVIDRILLLTSLKL